MIEASEEVRYSQPAHFTVRPEQTVPVTGSEIAHLRRRVESLIDRANTRMVWASTLASVSATFLTAGIATSSARGGTLDAVTALLLAAGAVTGAIALGLLMLLRETNRQRAASVADLLAELEELEHRRAGEDGPNRGA